MLDATYTQAISLKNDIAAVQNFIDNILEETPEEVSVDDMINLLNKLAGLAGVTNADVATAINTANINYYTAIRTALTTQLTALQTSFTEL